MLLGCSPDVLRRRRLIYLPSRIHHLVVGKRRMPVPWEALIPFGECRSRRSRRSERRQQAYGSSFRTLCRSLDRLFRRDRNLVQHRQAGNQRWQGRYRRSFPSRCTALTRALPCSFSIAAAIQPRFVGPHDDGTGRKADGIMERSNSAFRTCPSPAERHLILPFDSPSR